MKSNKYFLAFTLAEVMVVLVLIGVLALILFPAICHSIPDRNLNKFLKAHNTLYSSISELVNSDKYYLNGDMGIKFDGTYIDSHSYFCQTFSDTIKYKSLNCDNDFYEYIYGHLDFRDESMFNIMFAEIDKRCAFAQTHVKNQIVMLDNTVFFEGSPAVHYGIRLNECTTPLNPDLVMTSTARLFKDVLTDDGQNKMYKIICIDVDGIPDGLTEYDSIVEQYYNDTECINECPFGYGVRYDGKIINGQRAQEWLEKATQK